MDFHHLPNNEETTPAHEPDEESNKLSHSEPEESEEELTEDEDTERHPLDMADAPIAKLNATEKGIY